ncbi:MAG: flavodoxin family protein [Lachnospirales bacterium]
MKTLIINGSPRKNGNTAFIIDKLIKKFDEKTDVINTFELNYSPCIDCGNCTEGKCIYDDFFSDLFNSIDEYDNIILASPLYFNQPTGSLLSFMSRFQILFNAKITLKPKMGGIIVVGGGDTIVNSADAEKTMRIILRGLNIDRFAYIRSLHTSTIPANMDKSIDIQIEEFLNIIKLGI